MSLVYSVVAGGTEVIDYSGEDVSTWTNMSHGEANLRDNDFTGILNIAEKDSESKANRFGYLKIEAGEIISGTIWEPTGTLEVTSQAGEPQEGVATTRISAPYDFETQGCIAVAGDVSWSLEAGQVISLVNPPEEWGTVTDLGINPIPNPDEGYDEYTAEAISEAVGQDRFTVIKVEGDIGPATSLTVVDWKVVKLSDLIYE